MMTFWQGFEKRAGVVSTLFNKIPWVKQYKGIANSPSFKAKKILGTTALVGSGVAYGGHKLTAAPQSMQEMSQQSQP